MDRAPRATCMFRVVPVLVPIFMQAKQGPWRELILCAWKTLRMDPKSPVHGQKRPLSSVLGAKAAHSVLVMAVKGMDRDKSLRAQVTCWNKLNVGVQHHSGFVPMCIGLSVIETEGPLNLGMKDSMYKVVADKSHAVAKLKAMGEAWQSLSPVRSPPRTCVEWRRFMVEAMQVLTQKAAPRLNPNHGAYCPSWTLRCYLFMVMRGQGVQRMRWGRIGVRGVGQMNPDQKGWLSVLEQHVKTTGALRKFVGEACPPELLSCQLCLLSKKVFDAYDADWICSARRYIQIVAAIGERLQQQVPQPTEEVLAETAALLR